MICDSSIAFTVRSNCGLVQALTEAMRANNPGRTISATAVRGFASREAANQYESTNPESVLGGVFFSTQLDGSVGYVLQVGLSDP